MNSYQAEYLNIWKKAFGKFLGWTEDQTVSWAQLLLEDLALPGVVLNEPPLYYVARELAWMRPYYETCEPAQREGLVRAVEAVISANHTFRDFPQGFDFEKARRVVETMLKSERSARRALRRQEKTFRQVSEERYVRVWTAVIRNLLGWSHTRISRRLVILRQRFRRRFKEMIRQEPVFWIADLLIPPGLQKRVGRSEARNLKEKLVGAIENGNFMWYEDENYDWQKSRDRISALLARSGRTADDSYKGGSDERTAKYVRKQRSGT